MFLYIKNKKKLIFYFKYNYVYIIYTSSSLNCCGDGCGDDCDDDRSDGGDDDDESYKYK